MPFPKNVMTPDSEQSHTSLAPASKYSEVFSVISASELLGKLSSAPRGEAVRLSVLPWLKPTSQRLREQLSLAPRLRGRHRRQIGRKLVRMECFHVQFNQAENRHPQVHRAPG